MDRQINPLGSFLRQMLTILLPAAIFFLTGAAAVFRQGTGYRMERQQKDVEEEVQTLQTMRSELRQEIAELKSRNRIMEIATEKLSLHQPTGEEIVILKMLPTDSLKTHSEGLAGLDRSQSQSSSSISQASISESKPTQRD